MTVQFVMINRKSENKPCDLSLWQKSNAEEETIVLFL